MVWAKDSNHSYENPTSSAANYFCSWQFPCRVQWKEIFICIADAISKKGRVCGSIAIIAHMGDTACSQWDGEVVTGQWFDSLFVFQLLAMGNVHSLLLLILWPYNHCLSALIILPPPLPYTHTFPWSLRSPSHHVRFLPGDPLFPNKGRALELASGGKRLRECNVSVSIQAASGNKYWHIILFFSFLSPLSVCGQTFTSITAVRESGRKSPCHQGDRHEWYIFQPFLPFLPSPSRSFLCTFFEAGSPFCSRPVVDLSGEKAKPFPTR